MTESYPSIHLGSPGEDICIKDLRLVKQRFKKLHQIRTQRIQAFLQPRQQLFLDLLPLIFHGNYPLLPGFISSETPAGIHEYSPGSRALKAAEKFTKNFSYNRHNSAHCSIDGLFLMGSAGSFAFSNSSDIDVWLCHHAGLDSDGLNALQLKARAVEIWAESLGLEVHFFLMDSIQFRLGRAAPISAESSGETQHYLLLEEFYRTSVYIAGKSLAWWLVPPHQENNYAGYLEHLKAQRFINEQEVIDFGGLAVVPAEEFIGGTLWHIYKSLHSPHKSLLKLLLMECYASEYPNPEWLCFDIKKAIYQGNFSVADLDPYFLIQQKVETYLQKTDSADRLALARQNFYLKIMDTAGKSPDAGTLAAKERYLSDVAKRRNWPATILEDFKQQQSWDINKALAEHEIILRQLTQSFRMIMGFAGNHVNGNYRNNNDIKLIGRKLYSFLEKKPGKIEFVTTRSAVQTQAQELSIVETGHDRDTQGWSLFLNNIRKSDADGFAPIHKSRTLIEVLGWLTGNGFYHNHQKLHLSSHSLKMTDEELHSVLKHLELFLRHKFDQETSLTTYLSANMPIKSLVFINFGIAVAADDRDSGHCLISERSDVLSYGAESTCFVETIDRIALSSWSEITCSRYEGVEGLFDCLTDIINNNRKPLSRHDLTLICNTPLRAKSIIQRVYRVFDNLAKLFAKKLNSGTARYILPGGPSYYVFRHEHKVLVYKPLATIDQVLKELARPHEYFSPVHFDDAVLADTPIPLLYTLNRPQIIQLFYIEIRPLITFYIIDEKGALYSQQHKQSNPDQLLNQYSIFLQNLINRNFFDTDVSIEYAELRKNPQGGISCTPIPQTYLTSTQALNVRISGVTSQNRLSYTIYCNEKEFSSLEHGNRVFQAAQQYVTRFRQSRQDYPVYVTDIDLPLSAIGVNSPNQLQTIYYLNFKQKLEAKLNA